MSEAPPKPRPQWRKYAMGLPLALAAGAGALLLGIDTPIGHRLIADALESADLGQGLRLSVARIEGSVYGDARLEGLTLRDPKGIFLRAPQAELDWRPLSWFQHGLVVRHAVIRRGTLLRLPQLRPGDPNASLWPDFDIALDSVALERLTIAKPVAGIERRVDLSGHLRLAKGVAKIALDGKLGGEDHLSALLDAQQAQNRFALRLRYDAPKGGLLAALSGTNQDRHLRADGQGTWTQWRGFLTADQAGKRAATLQIAQSQNQFTLAGKLWADPLLDPETRAMLGKGATALRLDAHLDQGALQTRLALSGPVVKLAAHGGINLAQHAYDHLAIEAAAPNALRVDADSTFEHLSVKAELDGPFATAQARFSAHTSRWVKDTTHLVGLSAQGTAIRKGNRWIAPTHLATDRIETEDRVFDDQLHNVRAHGTITIAGPKFTSDDLVLTIPKGTARASMRIDAAKGSYIFAGPAKVHDWPTRYGAAQAQGRVLVTFLRGTPWRAKIDAQGAIPNPTNAALLHVSGGGLNFSTQVEAGRNHYLTLRQGWIEAPTLSLHFEGARGPDGRIAVEGKGDQRHYGAFSGQISLGDPGLSGALHFPDPFPAIGIRDVDITLTPEAAALRIETKGQSLLGPFEGALGLVMPPDDAPDSAKSKLTLRGLNLSDTYVSGAIELGQSGADGTLGVSGGGLRGTVKLSSQNGAQGVEANLSAKDAHFAGDSPLTIAKGQLKLSGLIQKYHTTLSGDLSAQGVGKGKLFIGTLAMAANLRDGAGRVTAAIGGRRGSRFDMRLAANVAPERIALQTSGSYAGQTITMPRPAILTAKLRADGTTSEWNLAQSQINYGGGRVVAQGAIGNGSLDLTLGLVDMPLSLGDVALPDMGLGGKVSGQVTYSQQREAMPTGSAKLVVKSLTRAGLVLVSRPVDVALVGRLSANALDMRAVASENGQGRGRLQARIDNLAETGLLPDRLRNGRLIGQLRYAGPADALWRLMALDNFDLTGPVDLAADMTGTLESPDIRGNLSGDNLRLQSAAAGTDVTGIAASGSFIGSQLRLTSLAGKASGGQITGSGTVNFAGMEGGRGPSIDIALATRRAQLLARPDMAVTVTGPMRILSDGLTGTIAGRLVIERARWRLGQANAAADLPSATVREINRRTDVAPGSERQMPWNLMVDASGGGIRVQGLGMDSLWNANLQLRGALLDPAIGGAANMVEGTYDFASKHFDLTRGRISFDGTSPPDPRLDIAASATLTNLTATVTVRGTANKPEVDFSSIPALPEEELLARILFGDSITQISAPEAIQLGAALAALRSGGGLDPINKLRSVVGLDRLRFVAADAALGRQTSVAVGKYLGKHFYAEIITDGRGYSATNLEFRLTSWLALLASVASNERQSINAKYSKDF
jgi:translocation and assembly module TamB